jgi:hypothetical protein
MGAITDADDGGAPVTGAGAELAPACPEAGWGISPSAIAPRFAAIAHAHCSRPPFSVITRTPAID